ncbi:hypothetical protein GCM10022240_13260 [Microbacterium kribbense]|uniref:Restriction endonuclease n=1 Tax=Microbacterium kribbense TaxID=433645 RepID=A0ABP7GCG4_9MICO
METGRYVNWEDGREEFERVVESLIQRTWSTRDDGHAYVIDGRGGDDGLDVYVSRDDEIVQVYQLKFFPEGMSGGFRKRREQVKLSFERVAGLANLEEWTLITPRNPTVAELKSTLALRRGRTVRIQVWGRGELDEAIAKHPDLLAAATRRPLLDALRVAAHESAGLGGVGDLAERALKLGQLADSRSPYWGVKVTTDGHTVTQSLFAKRPDASEKEPIKLRFAPTFGDEHKPLLKEFTRLVEYGGSRSLLLPPEVLGVFETLGPEWIADRSKGSLEIQPQALPKPLPAEIRVVSARGGLLASLPGEIRLISSGSRGITVEGQFLTLTITFRVPRDAEGGEADFSYDLHSMTATSALALLKFIDLIESGEMWELHGAERRLFGMEGPTRRTRGSDPLPADTFEMVEDLAVLENAYGVTFPFPAAITNKDRIDVRVARMLTEGRATYSPQLGALTATISATADPREIGELGDPHAIAASFSDSTFTVLNRPLPIGTLRMYHPSLRATDIRAHITAIKSGNGEGRLLVLEPSDGTPIRVWLEERWTDPNKRIVPEPWGLEGITEHAGLGLIATAAEPRVADDDAAEGRPHAT